MEDKDFKNHRDALNEVVLSEHNTPESKKTVCLQSIAHSLIDVSELLWRIEMNLRK